MTFRQTDLCKREGRAEIAEVAGKEAELVEWSLSPVAPSFLKGDQKTEYPYRRDNQLHKIGGPTTSSSLPAEESLLSCTPLSHGREQRASNECKILLPPVISAVLKKLQGSLPNPRLLSHNCQLSTHTLKRQYVCAEVGTSRLPTNVGFTAISRQVQQDEEYEIPFSAPTNSFCQQQLWGQEQKHEEQHHNSHQSAALS